MTTTPPAPPARLRDLVAARVNEILERKQVSGSELARLLGMNQPYVWRRLNGEVEFSLTDLEKIAQVLRISALSLITRPKREAANPTRLLRIPAAAGGSGRGSKLH